MANIEGIEDQLEELSNSDLYDLASHLLATSTDKSDETLMKMLLHVVVIQDTLLKRLGFGKPPEQQMRPKYGGPPRRRGVPLKPTKKNINLVHKAVEAGAEVHGNVMRRTVEAKSSLTHNPFAEALKKKD